MKLSTKLYLVTGVLVAVAVAVGLIGVAGLRRTNAGLETVYNDRVVPLKQLKAIADDYAVAIIDAVNKANAGIFTAEETLKGVESASANIRKNWSDYMATQLTPEEAKLAGEAKNLYVAADAAVDDLRRFLSSRKGSVKGEMGEFDGPLYTTIDPISGKITELVELQLRVAKEEYTAAHERFGSLLIVFTVVIVAGVGLGGGYALVVNRATNRTLTEIAGSLTCGASQTADAAAQVSSASQTLAEGASEQAASLEETSASLEELTSMVKRSADSSESARQVAANTRAAAEIGVKSNLRLSASLDSIRGAAGEMRNAVERIKTSSNDVAKIIKTIDEIAFQTNILALNAAVEAARAGEAGQGFAVVADEVRNLAQRSAEAAKQTATLIEASVQQSNQGVAVNERVLASVDTVAAAAADVGKSLDQIVGRVTDVDTQVSEIAAACREQASGITQINIAVTQLDKVTQGNAASAEESAAASEELKAQSETVRESVRRLQQLVGESIPATSGGVGRVAGVTPVAAHAKPVAHPKSPGARPNPETASALPMPARSETKSFPGSTGGGDFRDF